MISCDQERIFQGQRVLLYDSKLHLFPGKLKSRRNCKENEGRSREQKGAQNQEISMVCEISQPKIAPAKMAIGCEIISQPLVSAAKSRFGCENGPPLRNKFRSPTPSSAKIFAAAKPPLGTRVPFRSTVTPFRSCEMAAKSPKS
ncbi:hypothetical protein CK203_082462 [Vitis vinifera]|uniref:Uncharacterized protein n=1 Tax=Vitis vinifera TaxID=29760 RepID=A0A438BNH5_VITVI|nr:hypothetical protein CK203_082462 [Vitis vinifera]